MRQLVVIIGPSGVGKSTLARALHDRGTATVWPTFTTRPPRSDEVGGTAEHVFVDPDHFADLERRGCFVATAALPDLPHRYGLPRLDGPEPTSVPVVIARAEQVPALRRLATDVQVLAVMTDRDAAEARLRNRRLPAAEVTARLAAGGREVALIRDLADHVLVNNGTVDQLAGGAEAVLRLQPAPGRRRRRQRGWFERVAITIGVLTGVGVAVYVLAVVSLALVIAAGGIGYGGSNK